MMRKTETKKRGEIVVLPQFEVALLSSVVVVVFVVVVVLPHVFFEE